MTETPPPEPGTRFRLATYNVEWFNALFDNDDNLLADRGWSARHNIRRRDQARSIARVLRAMDPDAILIVEAPDNNHRRSSVRALENFARHYRLRGATATFGIIASVSNPFCDTCNRLRLTADGKLKNCLFAGTETDLLAAHRRGEDIVPVILRSVLHKARRRGGMEELEQLSDPALHGANRAMVAIGG